MNAHPKDQLNVIRIIHLALIGGIAFFSLVVAFLILGKETTSNEIELFNYFSPALFFIVIIIQAQMFKITIKPALEKEIPLSKKLATFQTANIIRMALLEGCGLFAAVVALLNNEILHLVTVALTLGLMFAKLPTPLLLETEIQLSRNEKDQLTEEG
ncbi:MAG: hypothetical protein ABJG47_16955 [Ekhidna sp.]